MPHGAWIVAGKPLKIGKNPVPPLVPQAVECRRKKCTIFQSVTLSGGTRSLPGRFALTPINAELLAGRLLLGKMVGNTLVAVDARQSILERLLHHLRGLRLLMRIHRRCGMTVAAFP